MSAARLPAAGSLAARLRMVTRREGSVAMLLAVIIAVVSIGNPAFLAPGNLRDILVNASPTLIVACGVTLVILAGDIDISVGSLLGFLGVLLGLLTSAKHAALPVPLAVILVLLAGATVGLINGVLTACLQIPSIIVTLGMLTILRGITELLMGGQWITDLPPGLRRLGIGTLAGIPISLWSALLVSVAVFVLTRWTPVGRRIYAVGSNPRAAALYGISQVRVRIFVFTLTGLLVGIAAVVSIPQLSVIEAGVGRGFELLVITCVVVGGTSIRGGIGTIPGTILGTLLLTIIRTVLIFLPLGQAATYWERTIQGGLILLAVLADHLARRHRGEEDES